MASESIYRVVVSKTGSLQPTGESHWQKEVVYCGPSLRDARIAYLREVEGDFGGSYGNPSRDTKIEEFEAEPTDEIDDETRQTVDVDVD